MAHLSNHRSVDRVRVFGQRYTLLSANSGSRIHHDRPGKKKSEKRRSARLRSGRQTQTQRKATVPAPAVISKRPSLSATNRRSGIEAAYSEYPGAHRLVSKRSTDISVIVIDSVRLRGNLLPVRPKSRRVWTSSIPPSQWRASSAKKSPSTQQTVYEHHDMPKIEPS
jgi:hypothetical protein